MKRIFFAAAVAVSATAVFAMPKPSEVTASIPGAVMIGSGPAKFLGRTVYDIALWAPGGQSFSKERPFGLAITYKTSLSGDFLAKVSADEVARIEGTKKSAQDSLRQKLNKCFRDVRAGDRITGVSKGATSAVFFMNGRKTCSVSHPAFRDRFFGIWLGSGTRDKGLRAKLLGK